MHTGPRPLAGVVQQVAEHLFEVFNRHADHDVVRHVNGEGQVTLDVQAFRGTSQRLGGVGHAGAGAKCAAGTGARLREV